MYKLLLLFNLVAMILKQADCSQANLVSRSINNFGFELLKQMLDHDGQTNHFESPLSIGSALTMLANGAHGTTQTELRSVMQYHNDINAINSEWKQIINSIQNEISSNEVAFGDKIIARRGTYILESFRNIIKNFFDGEIDVVKDNIEERINGWVREKTHGIIKTLVDKVEPNLRLAIFNAIYFKGIWHSKFKKSETDKSATFYNKGVNRKTIELMYQKETYKFLHSNELDAKLIEIPYSGFRIKMLIILPNRLDGIHNLLNQLNSFDQIKKFTKRMKRTKVKTYIPKFQIETNYDLKTYLQGQGIIKSFGGGADFSGINGRRDLFISNVIHKAVIQVDEEGTRAAAATGVIMMRSASAQSQQDQEFKADHPFLFFIIDYDNQIVLFCGVINHL